MSIGIRGSKRQPKAFRFYLQERLLWFQKKLSLQEKLSCFFDGQDSAALVLAALLAGAMRELLFAAVAAVGDAYWRKEVVAAALGSALLGVAPFRIRHDETSSIQAASTRLR
jgi:hypothetical protein